MVLSGSQSKALTAVHSPPPIIVDYILGPRKLCVLFSASVFQCSQICCVSSCCVSSSLCVKFGLCAPQSQHVQRGAAEAGRQPQHQRGELRRRAEGGGPSGAARPRAAGPVSAQEEGGQNLQQDRCQALHQRQEVDPPLSAVLCVLCWLRACGPALPRRLHSASAPVSCHPLVVQFSPSHC